MWCILSERILFNLLKTLFIVNLNSCSLSLNVKDKRCKKVSKLLIVLLRSKLSRIFGGFIYKLSWESKNQKAYLDYVIRLNLSLT